MSTAITRVTQGHPGSQEPQGVISQRQELAIAILLMGGTDAEAAAAAGVARETISRWRSGHAEFMREINRRREALWLQQRELASSLVVEAMQTLRRSLHSASESQRIKAASVLLRAIERPALEAPIQLEVPWREEVREAGYPVIENPQERDLARRILQGLIDEQDADARGQEEVTAPVGAATARRAHRRQRHYSGVGLTTLDAPLGGRKEEGEILLPGSPQAPGAFTRVPTP